MIKTLAISKTIITLADLQERFNLSPTTDDQFFLEWQQNLPDLNAVKLETIDQIYNRFLRHRERSVFAEGTVNQLLISPLLTLA